MYMNFVYWALGYSVPYTTLNFLFKQLQEYICQWQDGSFLKAMDFANRNGNLLDCWVKLFDTRSKCHSHMSFKSTRICLRLKFQLQKTCNGHMRLQTLQSLWTSGKRQLVTKNSYSHTGSHISLATTRNFHPLINRRTM